ncbi:Two-component response regulator-like [Parasponia andersonii]|uniref:Two-component response regulator-like n=1 Tax=Parasponia andersonii TaxID=3476 RepID=A0A2P5E053_PARAD|nr:Two-component response regulator-like [Parasponia andersonii]
MEVEVEEAEKRQQNNDNDKEKEVEVDEENDGFKESYLPWMVLRVLLVEADDSTRQIVTALLRKCGYRVYAVPDGLKAWETLEERARNIDLILTEVELPSISGFALLTLVMEHDVCKNIPVIMMSSQDSISMVLKCMLKGAADYLIKPLRRNELRNLWQHVWRKKTLVHRQLPQNTTAPQHQVEPASENNTASNRSSDYVASIKHTKELSEKVSDVQSSCTTPYLEAESEHIPHLQDISHTKSGTASNLSKNNVEIHEDCAKLNEEAVMHVSKTGEKSNIFKPEVVSCNEAFRSTVLRLKGEHTCNKRMKQDETAMTENYKVNANVETEIESDELVNPSSGAIDLIGTFDDRPRCTKGSSIVNVDGINNSEYSPQLELSLLRVCPRGFNGQGSGERPKLNHSNASAFSWYNNNNTLRPFFPTLSSSHTKSEDCLKKTEEFLFSQSSENSPRASQERAATGSSCQDNFPAIVVGESGQTEAPFPSPQLGLIPVTSLRFDDVSSGYSQFFPSFFYAQSSLSPIWSPISASQGEKSPSAVNTSNHSDPRVHDSEQGYQRSEETRNTSLEQTKEEQRKLEFVEELKPCSLGADRSAGGSFCCGVADYIKSDARGSICGKNDGSATSAMADEKITASQGLNENGHYVHERFRGMDSVRSSQREVALTKFRMKRKDRCFEKKVRYQSRKRLAEQRPRVKGQFVRQVQNGPPLIADGL